MSGADTANILKELAEIKGQLKCPRAWIEGNVALGRYIGSKDKSGRKAAAFAKAAGLYVKRINGTPHYDMSEVDRVMRNGRPMETFKSSKSETLTMKEAV